MSKRVSLGLILFEKLNKEFHEKQLRWIWCTFSSMFQLQSLSPGNYMISRWAASWQNQEMACVLSEDSDQPGHPPNLIRVFAVRVKKHWVLRYPLSAQRRLWADWADAQADLSLRWAHSHFVGFVMRQLRCCKATYVPSQDYINRRTERRRQRTRGGWRPH